MANKAFTAFSERVEQAFKGKPHYADLIALYVSSAELSFCSF